MRHTTPHHTTPYHATPHQTLNGMRFPNSGPVPVVCEAADPQFDSVWGASSAFFRTSTMEAAGACTTTQRNCSTGAPIQQVGVGVGVWVCWCVGELQVWV